MKIEGGRDWQEGIILVWPSDEHSVQYVSVSGCVDQFE